MTDKSREAVKRILRAACSKYYAEACGRGPASCITKWHQELYSALAEPEEPNIERVELLVGNLVQNTNLYANLERDSQDGWRFYAERPIPAKTKAEELADRMDARADSMLTRPDDTYDLLKRAAAELRRKR